MCFYVDSLSSHYDPQPGDWPTTQSQYGGSSIWLMHIWQIALPQMMFVWHISTHLENPIQYFIAAAALMHMMLWCQQNKCYPQRRLFCPFDFSHSKFTSHNNTSQICYCAKFHHRILQLTPLGVSFILLSILHEVRQHKCSVGVRCTIGNSRNSFLNSFTPV